METDLMTITRKSLDPASFVKKPAPPPNSSKPKRPLSLPLGDQNLPQSPPSLLGGSSSSSVSRSTSPSPSPPSTISKSGEQAIYSLNRSNGSNGSNRSPSSSTSSGFLTSPQSSPPSSRRPPSFKPPPKSNSILFSVIYDKTSAGIKDVEIDDILPRVNLQRIIMARNLIEVIPERISELQHVNTLDFSYNRLKSLPSSISNMQELTTLLLAGNQLLIPAKDYIDNTSSIVNDIGEIELDEDCEADEESIGSSSNTNNKNDSQSKSLSFIVSTTSSTSSNDLPQHVHKLNSSVTTTTNSTTLINTNNNSNNNQQAESLQTSGGEALPSEFSYLTHLTKVDLTSNIAPNWIGNTYLPPSLFWFSQITTLLASHCQLAAIQSDIQHLISLTHLDLSDNAIGELPAEIGQLINLKTLVLRSNQLVAVPSELSMLSNSLTNLDLSHNQLTELPVELCQLSKLDTLNLSYNQLTAIPEEWFNPDDDFGFALHSLTDLRIRSNSITALPQHLFLCQCKFNYLDLSDNQLLELPPITYETINEEGEEGEETYEQTNFDLESLSTLLLFNNKLSQLPNNLFQQLPSINTLNLSDNQLVSLSPSIWSCCHSLSTLFIGYNRLESFPMPSDSFYSLEELYLNGNRDIKFEYDESIDYFPSLRELALGSCNLDVIPPFLFKSCSLDKLDLANNQISEIDLQLVRMESLSILHLNHNRLVSLPNELENLKNLRMLDLSFNSIESLPKGLFSHSSNNSQQLHLTHHHNASDLSNQFGETCDIWTESKRFDIAMAEMMGRRPSMEDAFTIRGNFSSSSSSLSSSSSSSSNDNQDLIALFDGHAGAMAATYSCKWFPQIVRTLIEKYPSLPPLQWLKQAYSEVSLHFKSYVNNEHQELKYCGATAAAVLIENNHYYVSNIGDTRVVLCRNGQAKRLSFDHKPNDPSEEERIRKLGGYVISNQHTARVNGTLAVSRSIGDFYMEPFVVPDPYLSITEAHPDDQYLIVACDGIWDEITDQTACDIILNSKSLKDAAYRLKDFAYFKGSDDNITVIIIDLKKQH
ncbi:protein phosphatase 2C [Heterostelium album PN500]|uniref:Protein phosphatase 2C n=1 Tax=Heterostelium pallidum (strain ATCC 26659 / Pp 5 / PN500) TaxID=670386 RepID=D3BU16_HETP5|nr:protein phosphatase 2C [Heterostelium album PN500]EFA75202.1 protein phosphatase 2C [Heterostelium album PN500]|eukprot:XP_020427336.1 protein phosphatase 2C [Heterostelium album PN500]